MLYINKQLKTYWLKGKFLKIPSGRRVQLKNLPIDYANKSCIKAINETLSINRVWIANKFRVLKYSCVCVCSYFYIHFFPSFLHLCEL